MSVTSVINDSFRTYNLQQFIDSLSAGNSLYLGIGRPQTWNPGDLPDTPYNALLNEDKDWEDMIALKRLTSSDVTFGIPKLIWLPNVRYDTYRHDWGISGRTSVYDGSIPTSLTSAFYYVINSLNDLYICLRQKTVLGVVQPSLYEPGVTGVSFSDDPYVIQTADGYVWKFVANTTTQDVVDFQTTDYTPVKTLTVADLSDQWASQVSSEAFRRGIFTVNVTSGGTGYNGGAAGSSTEADATLQIQGNGTGLKYTVTYASGGVISDISITNPGTGYTFATVSTTTGSSAAFDIIFTPQYGLGTDPVRDLQATFLITNVKLAGDEGGLTVANDYRKISLVSNPTDYGTSTISTTTILDAATMISIPGSVGAFVSDAVVTDTTTGAKGIVVDWISTSSALRIVQPRDAFTTYGSASNHFVVGHNVTTSNGTGPTGAIAAITTPTVQPYSGHILYTEYRAPLARNITQTENITLVIQF